jgi:replicative DNA helicase
MGKFALSLKIALRSVMEKNIPIIIFSPTESKKRIVQRMISIVGKVDFCDLLRGRIRKESLQRFDKALDELKSRLIYIDDTIIISAAEIRRKCKKLVKKGIMPGLVIIDGVQQIEHNQTKKEIKKLVKVLKNMAIELNIPVFVTSILNRESEKRVDHRPRLATDFGDYRILANAADAVILQYRNSYYQNPEDCDDEYAWLMDCELSVTSKSNNGDNSKIFLRYTPEYLLFEPWHMDSEDDL